MDGKRNGFMDKILDTDGNGRHGYFDHVLDGQYADESDNEKIFYDEECGDIDLEYAMTIGLTMILTGSMTMISK